MSDAFARDGRFEIRTANNGFDAGMLVKEFRPDVVVLDIMLPDINAKKFASASGPTKRWSRRRSSASAACSSRT